MLDSRLSGHDSPLVLLVEDQIPLRELIEEVLRRDGFQVITAANGTEGLRLAQQNKDGLNLLITDIDLPGINGFELARSVREDRADLPIIYIPAVSETLTSNLPLVEPESLLLMKPFSVRKLSAVAFALLRVTSS
jgi:two-component system, OmpR family, response regulator